MKKILLSGMALTLLVVACGEEEGHKEQPIPEYTSPAKILKTVQISFNQRNIVYLKAALSPNFVFYFDPDDVGQNPPGGSKYVIPERWTYTEFWQAVDKMFEFAYGISLTIPAGEIGTPGPEETTYDAKNVNIKILVLDVQHK